MTNKIWRMIFGGLLILGGGLMLLQQAGILSSAWDVFWSIIIILGGLAFMSVYASNRRHWWALIPGLTLLGAGFVSILPDSLGALGGAVFLGMLALAFWLIYGFGTHNWWAIIPGGVLATLAVVSIFSSITGTPFLGIVIDSWIVGGLFFLGLAVTFFLVALLPKPQGRMDWAFIPSAVLFLMALGTATLKMQDVMIYIWPVVLLLAGIYLIYLYFKNK